MRTAIPACDVLKCSPLYDKVEVVREEPVNFTTDFNEGVFVELGCIACRETTDARLGVAKPARMYVAGLKCRECGESLVEFDVMSGRVA